jgi:hypothetical protein
MPTSPIRSKPFTALDPASPAFERLQSYFRGGIVLPTDSDYLAVCARWAANAEKPAGAVVFPKDDFDVAAAVRFATGEGLEIAVNSEL